VGEEVVDLFYLMQKNKVSINVSVCVPYFFKHLPFNSIKDRSCDLWHPSHSIIRLIQSVVSYISCKQNTICPICPLAKQYKLSFPISSSISNYVFNLLHRDVRGHMTTKSINGSRFFSHYYR
jgi:hypothetical protein